MYKLQDAEIASDILTTLKMLHNVDQNSSFRSRDMVRTSWPQTDIFHVTMKLWAMSQDLIISFYLLTMVCLHKLGQNPSTGSGDTVWTKWKSAVNLT